MEEAALRDGEEIDKNEINGDDLVESEIFEREARRLYEGKVQEHLVKGKWYTLVDALDDTLDTWTYQRSMFDWPTHNTYIPVRHTIMPKPEMWDNFGDDAGFRFGQTFDGLAINPAD